MVPINNHHNNIETLIETVRNEINKKQGNREYSETQIHQYVNMLLKENKVLKELQSRNDIIIKIAGKGSALVIIDVIH